MEELLLILFFLFLVLVFAGAMLAYLRLARREARAEREARVEALAELREAMRKLEERLSRLQASPRVGAEISPGEMAGSSPIAGHEAVVEAELRRLGFGKIRLLASQPDPASGELPVEAQKDQIEYKGRVILRDGAVVECRLTPSYEVFP